MSDGTWIDQRGQVGIAQWVYSVAEPDQSRVVVAIYDKEESSGAAYIAKRGGLVIIKRAELPDLPIEELKNYLVTLWRMS
jgi:hypothetical protein